nr:PEP-CTERM sorting domain-containing protein [Duganella aceris]
MKLAALNALAVACLAAFASPAYADAYSTATFGNVTVTLIDLDPNDGVAASISFLPNPNKFAGGAYVYGEAETGQVGGYDPGHQLGRFDKSGAWQTTNVSGSTSTNLATSSASVTGAADGVGFSGLSLSGAAHSTSDQHSRFYAYAGVPNTHDNKGFTLSANTMVSFSVNTTMSASTTIGYTPGALEGEAASVLMSLYAGGLSPDGGSMVDDLQQHSVSVYYVDGDPLGGASDSWSGIMTASFSNLSNHSTQGEFFADASIGGRSVISAVPEPGTYGMLLGGLGLMGALARRRRNRGQ